MASTNNLSQWLLGEAALHKEPPGAGVPALLVAGVQLMLLPTALYG